MAHPVCYLIDMNGEQFNAVMKVDHQAPSGYIVELREREKFDLWDGMLVGNDTSFLVDLSGYWTLCTLAYPYSALLADNNPRGIQTQIFDWEMALCKAIPLNTIYRLDDILLDPWNARYDYLLTRNPKVVDSFISWLQTQDSMHWSLIACPSGTEAVVRPGQTP